MLAVRGLRVLLCGLVIAGLALPNAVRAEDFSAVQLVDPAEVERLVKPLVDGGWIEGLAIGLIGEQGTQTLGFGHTSETNPAPPTSETLFEIGSISKVFTATILAQMAVEEKLSIDDPVQKLLGESMVVPEGKERPITLRDLSTHSSGLPRMPSNFKPADAANPYADYSVELMAEFLKSHKLGRQPGDKSVYSNLGVGLLGHALAHRSGETYESLLKHVVLTRLEMNATKITLTPLDHEHLATGHDFDGNPVSNWDIPTLAGAGAIRSTIGDMLKFLAAQLGLKKSSLDAAIAKTHEIHFENPESETYDMGLGWLRMHKGDLLWHNGGTGGYNSFAGVNLKEKIGVVVFANSSTQYVDKLGTQLINLLAGKPVKPLDLPVNLKLSVEQLEPLVGKYEINKALTADVTRKDDRLFLQLSGQARIGIYATSATHFYCRPVEASFDFEADESGQITRMVIHQNGLDIPAVRVDKSADLDSSDDSAVKTPAG